MPTQTIASARVNLVARLNVAVGGALVECQSVNGLLDGGTQRLDRGFSVQPKSVKWHKKSRQASRVAGARVGAIFNVELGYILRPSDGLAAPATALDDLDAVLATLYTPDEDLTSGSASALVIGDVGFTYNDGGAYLIVSFTVEVVFALPLVPV